MPLHHQGQVTGSKDSIQSEIPLHEIPRTVKQARRRRGHRRNVERKVSTKYLQWCPTELRISHRNERHYRSPTKIPNRDKKTESPYLVHPLTYRQVYLTKDAYFVEKIHCELVEMA